MPTIPVTTPHGPQPTDAYYVRAGLAVTKMLDNPQWWHVTHIASGMCLDNAFRKRQRAKAYQDALLSTDIDWSQSGDVLRRRPDFQTTVRGILANYPRY